MRFTGKDGDDEPARPPIESARDPAGWLRIEPAQAILAALLALEIAVFAVIGTNFVSLANAFEVLRLCVEIGLLAVALDAGDHERRHRPVGRLADGPLGGRLRQALARWRAADRRGRGADAWSGRAGGQLERPADHARADSRRDRDARLVLAVPRPGRRADRRRRQLHPLPRARSSFWARAISLGGIPTQVPIFVVGRRGVLGACCIGRRSAAGLVAIGFSPEGARYAGLPVERLVGLVYVLSGLVASLAAIIYVAHLGQAKADAGTGYELAAITAVVLGGTSIFGGRGSVPGTLLGLLRDRRACRTACAWPTSPPSWPAS